MDTVRLLSRLDGLLLLWSISISSSGSPDAVGQSAVAGRSPKLCHSSVRGTTANEASAECTRNATPTCFQDVFMCRGNCASVCIRDEPERIATLQLLISRSAGLSCSFLGGVLRQVARQLSKPLVPSRGFSVCHPASFSGSCVFRDCRSPPGVVVGVLVAGLGQRRCLSGRNVSICRVPFALADHDARTNVSEHCPNLPPQISSRPSCRGAPNRASAPTIDD